LVSMVAEGFDRWSSVCREWMIGCSRRSSDCHSARQLSALLAESVKGPRSRRRFGFELLRAMFPIFDTFTSTCRCRFPLRNGFILVMPPEAPMDRLHLCGNLPTCCQRFPLVLLSFTPAEAISCSGYRKCNRTKNLDTIRSS